MSTERRTELIITTTENETPYDFVTTAPQFINSAIWNALIQSQHFHLSFHYSLLTINLKWQYKWNDTLGEFQFIRRIN